MRPTAAVSAALLKGYATILEEDLEAGGSGDTGNRHLAWMCRRAADEAGSWPIDKTSRWLGFVQGAMAARGLLSVEEERNTTRPLFHAAYLVEGRRPPLTAEPD